MKTYTIIGGVNGVGKTTTIGKLSAKLQREGKKVLLCAGDTFRAAAVEQLESWAAQAEDGELPEEMLELVSGGLLISSLLIGIAITTAATGVAVGTTVGIGAGVVSAIKNRW